MHYALPRIDHIYLCLRGRVVLIFQCTSRWIRYDPRKWVPLTKSPFIPLPEPKPWTRFRYGTTSCWRHEGGGVVFSRLLGRDLHHLANPFSINKEKGGETMASMLEKEFSVLCFLMRDRNFLEEENFEIGIRIDSIDFFINCFIVTVLKKKREL